MMNTKDAVRIGAAILGLGIASSGLTHHSYAQFDPCTVVTIKGELLATDYANPHIVLTVVDGDGETYRIEWMSLQQLTRNRLEPGVVTAGHQVEITGSRHRDPEVNVVTLLTEVRRSNDGWAWTRARGRPESCGR